MIPYVYGGNAHPGSITSGTLVLPASGGAVAIPIIVPSRMLAASVTVWCADTTGTHTLEAALYPDSDTNGLPSMHQAGLLGSWTWTAVGASARTGITTEVELAAGAWWLVIRNVGAATTALGRVAPGSLAGSVAATATIADLAPDLVGVAWSKSTSLPLVRINGVIDAVPGVVFA